MIFLLGLIQRHFLFEWYQILSEHSWTSEVSCSGPASDIHDVSMIHCAACVFSLQCSLHIHAAYSTAKSLNIPMVPLTEPNAVGLILAHGNSHFIVVVFFVQTIVLILCRIIWCLSTWHLTVFPIRECWWFHVSDEAWCVCVWWWWVHLDESPQWTPSLCYSGLWRAASCCGAHPQSTCQQYQVSYA